MNGTVILLCVDARLAHDEYTLDVFASDTIAVRGGSESGLRYGMQTLRQMIRQTSRTLPACISKTSLRSRCAPTVLT